MTQEKDIISCLNIKVARLEEQLRASNESLILAREAIEKRLEGMNEFRHQLDKQSSSFVTRNELWAFLATTIMITISIISLLQKFLK